MDFGHSAPNHVAKLLNKRKANIRNSITFTKIDSCEVSVVRTVLSSLRASWTPKTPLQDFNLQDVPTTFQFTLSLEFSLLSLDPSDGVFGRFDLAALCGCHTLPRADSTGTVAYRLRSIRECCQPIAAW